MPLFPCLPLLLEYSANTLQPLTACLCVQFAPKLAFKIFIEGNESVCFCWEVTALLKPLAIDSTTQLQQTTVKFSRI